MPRCPSGLAVPLEGHHVEDNSPTVITHAPASASPTGEGTTGRTKVILPGLSQGFMWWEIVGFFLIIGAMLSYILYGPTPGRTVPATVTVESSQVEYATNESPGKVISICFYEVDGYSYTYENTSIVAKGVVPTPDKVGSTFRIWVSDRDPEARSSTYIADPVSLFDYVAQISLALWIGLPVVPFLMWHIAVGTLQPAAAGLQHHVESGRRLWVRLLWHNGVLVNFLFGYGLPIMPLVLLLCGGMVGAMFGLSWAAGFVVVSTLTLIVLGALMMKNRNVDITADLTAGTLQVPVYDVENRTYLPPRSVAMADVVAFIVERYDEIINGSNMGSRSELKLRLASGEEILVALCLEGNLLSVLGKYGVPILARWLNQQLKLTAPAAA